MSLSWMFSGTRFGQLVGCSFLQKFTEETISDFLKEKKKMKVNRNPI